MGQSLRLQTPDHDQQRQASGVHRQGLPARCSYQQCTGPVTASSSILLRLASAEWTPGTLDRTLLLTPLPVLESGPSTGLRDGTPF
ncbi:hypothetical protein NHX12_001930 [Muraenolepis orangiensis]|uniref:Uncharacterized protein n=1 Tax=Muraenolepis orangiensis TaxID=630683 RepID=A0A9Q0IHN2_9TELE|nr:hypothetical protein NHX12_001930 [Muraenolepis orangiensis]